MAGFNAFFKNALNVNNVFTANSSNVVFADISINSLGFAVNTDSVKVGSNNITVGNTTVFTNLHFSNLSFLKGTNTASYNSSEIKVSSPTSEARINSTTIFLDTGNTLFGTVSSLRFGNSTVNAQVTTNAFYLRDSGTFLLPTSLQINSLGLINATHLSINTLVTATKQSTTLLTGNAAGLSVFNSTANGVVLAANNAGTPIQTNSYHLAGNQTWRKGYVWQNYYQWTNTKFPFFSWQANTFSTIDVTGWIENTVELSGDPEFRLYFYFNGSAKTQTNYFFNGQHFYANGETVMDSSDYNGGTFSWPNFEAGFELINFNLKFFNCEGQRPALYFRAAGYTPVVGGNVRVWSGWMGYDNATVPDGNGITAFQFFFTNGSINENNSGNLTITGIPF
jgi:hypothetical protein